MTAQVFKSKQGMGDILTFWILPALMMNHILKDLAYNKWLLLAGGILLAILVLTYFAERVQLTVDEHGIKQQLQHRVFARLKRNLDFSVDYADIRHLEVLGYGGKAYSLTIKHQQHDKQQTFSTRKYADLQGIINSIQRFHPFDATPVWPVGQGFELEGERVHQLLLVSVTGVVFSLVMKDFLTYWHPGNEGFGLLMAQVSPLVFVGAYCYIRGESKQFVFKKALMSGVMLSVAICMSIVSLNRYHTEHYGQLQTYNFVLENGSADKQRWYLPVQLVQDKAYIDLYKHSEVDFQPDLPLYYVYAIQVKTGYLNDWVFAPDAFKHARQLETANLKQFSRL